MATIPLPALDLKTPQEPGPLDNVSKLMALRSMMTNQQSAQQELQIRAQQVKDQQATTAAMKSWDGKDYDALAKSVLDNGGSATAAQGVQQHGLTVQKTVSDIAAQDATTGSKNLETFIGRHKAIGDALEGIESVPDDQLHGKATQTVSDLVKNGVLDQSTGQQLLQGVQAIQDPKALRAQIDVFAKSSMGAKAVAEQAKTAQETQTSAAQEQKDTADTEKTKLETELMRQYGTPQQQEAKYISLQSRKNQGMPLTPADAAFSKAYEKNKTLVPTATFNLQNAGATTPGGNGEPNAIIQGLANGTYKWNDVVSPRTPMSVKTAMAEEVKKINPNFDTSTYAIQTKAAEKATSGAWADTRVAYNTALDHSKQLLTAMDALDNGDVGRLNSLKNFFSKEFGQPGVPTYDAIANAYNHEVTSVVSKGHITDTEVKTGGAVLPDNSSPQQIRSVVGAYNSLMQSKRDELDKIIKAGAGNKANAVLGTESGGEKKDFFSNFGGKPKQ